MPSPSQSKQLVKSNGSLTDIHIGDTSDGLLVYSRRKQRGRSNGARVNGFLVYKRKKPKANSITDNTQATEVTSSSNGTNDSSDSDTDGSSSPFRRCKRCGKAGNVEMMLICDECEEAYHMRCCGVRMKEVAEIDDWICRSCLRKTSSKIEIKGTERESYRTISYKNSSRKRVSSGCSRLVRSNYEDLKNGKKPRSAVNWLQCREEDRNGDICGKWRRAPRSEECYCCVFWDPSHADCAVPQELETDEILKQIKYIKMLRTRSDAKTRKIGPNGQKQIT